MAIPPYAFAWANGSSAQNQTSLAAGIYEVTVTDANGCNALESFTVTEPDASLTAEGIVTNVLCFGESTGSISLSVNGGTSPYAFAWSNGSGAQNQTSLAAGNYEVTVTDANGCSALESFTVTEPDASLTAEGIVTNVLCFGESTGSISLSLNGGTSPYAFAWSNGSGAQNQTSLAAGIFEVTVTDANGCSALGKLYRDRTCCITDSKRYSYGRFLQCQFRW